MDNGASSYRRFLDGDDKGIAEIVAHRDTSLRHFGEGRHRYILNQSKKGREIFPYSLFEKNMIKSFDHS